MSRTFSLSIESDGRLRITFDWGVWESAPDTFRMDADMPCLNFDVRWDYNTRTPAVSYIGRPVAVNRVKEGGAA